MRRCLRGLALPCKVHFVQDAKRSGPSPTTPIGQCGRIRVSTCFTRVPSVEFSTCSESKTCGGALKGRTAWAILRCARLARSGTALHQFHFLKPSSTPLASLFFVTFPRWSWCRVREAGEITESAPHCFLPTSASSDLALRNSNGSIDLVEAALTLTTAAHLYVTTGAGAALATGAGAAYVTAGASLWPVLLTLHAYFCSWL